MRIKRCEKIENCLRLLGLKASKHEKGDAVGYGFTVGSAFQYDMRVCCSGRLLRVGVRLNAGQSALRRKLTCRRMDELNRIVPIVKFVNVCRSVECRLEVEEAWTLSLSDQAFRGLIMLPVAAMDLVCEVLR